MLRSLFTSRRPTTEEVYVTLEKNPELARSCIRVVRAALLGLKGNALFIRYAVQRFMRATKIVQRYVKSLFLKEQALLAREVESWIAYEKKCQDKPQFSVTKSVRFLIVKADFVKQRTAFRVVWRNWRKQVKGLQLQLDLATQERSTTTTVTRDRQIYLSLKLSQLQVKKPTFEFKVDYDSLFPILTNYLRNETMNKLETVMTDLGIKSKDPQFVRSLMEKYDTIIASQKRKVVVRNKASKSERQAWKLSSTNAFIGSVYVRSASMLSASKKEKHFRRRKPPTPQDGTAHMDSPVPLAEELAAPFLQPVESKYFSSSDELTTSKDDHVTPEREKVPEAHSRLGIVTGQYPIHSFEWKEEKKLDTPLLLRTQFVDAKDCEWYPRYHQPSFSNNFSGEDYRKRPKKPLVPHLSNTSTRLRQRSSQLPFPRETKPRPLAAVDYDELQRNEGRYPYHKYWEHQRTERDPDQPAWEAMQVSSNLGQHSPTKKIAAPPKVIQPDSLAIPVYWTNGKRAYSTSADVLLSEVSQKGLRNFYSVPYPSPKKPPVSGESVELLAEIASNLSRTAGTSETKTTPAEVKFCGHNGSVCCICCIPSGGAVRQDLVATGSHDGTMRIWSVQTGQSLHIDYHKDRVSHLCYIYGRLCTASDDRSVHVLKPSGEKEWELLHSFWVRSWTSCMIGVQHFLICAGYGCRVNIFNLQTLTNHYLLEGHVQNITCLASDSTTLVSGSLDGSLRVWREVFNTPSDEELPPHLSRLGPSYDEHTGAILDLRHFNETEFASASVDGTIRIWDSKDLVTRIQIFAQCQQLTSMMVLKSKSVLCCCSDGSARVFNGKTGSMMLDIRLANKEGFVTACAECHENQLALPTTNGEIFIVSAKSGITMATLRDHRNAINGCVYAKQFLYSCSDDRTAALFVVPKPLLGKGL